MQFIDTHCHLHDPQFFTPEAAEAAFKNSIEAGVTKILLVATSLEDSRRAVSFAHAHPENCYAVVGIHPHETSKMTELEIDSHLLKLEQLVTDEKVVGIGECGFDFYYNDKKAVLSLQERLLRGQLDIAVKHSLPLSFHVREAFNDFWRVFEDYKDIQGVLHSFTDRSDHLKTALGHNLRIGINGIATFTTHNWQRDLFKAVPLSSFVLETDSPFLTPKPKRGTINTPENVIYITKFMAEIRGETEETIAKATTANALKLFNLA